MIPESWSKHQPKPCAVWPVGDGQHPHSLCSSLITWTEQSIRILVSFPSWQSHPEEVGFYAAILCTQWETWNWDTFVQYEKCKDMHSCTHLFLLYTAVTAAVETQHWGGFAHLPPVRQHRGTLGNQVIFHFPWLCWLNSRHLLVNTFRNQRTYVINATCEKTPNNLVLYLWFKLFPFPLLSMQWWNWTLKTYTDPAVFSYLTRQKLHIHISAFCIVFWKCCLVCDRCCHTHRKQWI